jgi:hypothetical protein
MPTPSVYYETQLKLDGIKGMAFDLLMSEEVSLDGPLASRLADWVFDMSHTEADAAIKAFLASKQ